MINKSILSKQDQDIFTISVIIVTYKSEKFIHDCLNSIYNTDFSDFEVIVVDSETGRDDTVALIHKMNLPRLSLYCLKKNIGYAAGNNYGVKMSKGRFIVIMNPDVIVPRNFILNLYNEYLKLETIYQSQLILSPIVKIKNGTKHFFQGIINPLGFAFIPSKLYQKKKEKNDNHPAESISRPTDFISGCCFIIEKSLYNLLHGFDSSFFMYYEDVYFSLKAQTLKYPLRVSKAIALLHLQANDYRLTKWKYFYVERNRIYTVLKLAKNPIRQKILLLLFEPIMLIQSLITNMFVYRLLIYRRIVRTLFSQGKGSYLGHQIYFSKYAPKIGGLIDYLDLNPRLKLFLDHMIYTITTILVRIIFKKKDL